MGQNSKIEWTRHTFNCWVGCTKVSPACDHCYAEGWAKRTGQAALWQGERRRTSAANWQQPMKWDRAAAAAGERHRVFCASLADVFDNQVPDEWRDSLWLLIKDTPHLDWLLLTKRPQNIAKMLPKETFTGRAWGDGWPNVWLGTTVENQEEAERRIPHLLAVPARIRFLSCEPLLGPVDLSDIRRWDISSALQLDALAGRKYHHDDCGQWTRTSKLDWVIAGSESGHGARECDLAWVRSLRDQCSAAKVAFFWKQHVERGRKIPTPALDGRIWIEFPQTTV